MIESSQNGVVLSDEEIKEEVDTIMFEVKNFLKNNLKICYFLLCVKWFNNKQETFTV